MWYTAARISRKFLMYFLLNPFNLYSIPTESPHFQFHLIAFWTCTPYLRALPRMCLLNSFVHSFNSDSYTISLRDRHLHFILTTSIATFGMEWSWIESATNFINCNSFPFFCSSFHSLKLKHFDSTYLFKRTRDDLSNWNWNQNLYKTVSDLNSKR